MKPKRYTEVGRISEQLNRPPQMVEIANRWAISFDAGDNQITIWRTQDGKTWTQYGYVDIQVLS